MEDIPEQSQKTSQPMIHDGGKIVETGPPNDPKKAMEQMNTMQQKVDEQLGNIAGQIREGQGRQSQIVLASDTLVASLQDALQALQLSQSKRETSIRQNEIQLNTLLRNNLDLTGKNAELEQLTRGKLQALAIQEERQRLLSHQTENLQQKQRTQQQQMGTHGQATLQMQQDLLHMGESNRQRPEIPASRQFAPTIPGRRAPHRATFPTTPASEMPERAFGPMGPIQQQSANLNHPAMPNVSIDSPFRMPTNTDYGPTPLPRSGFPNMVVGPCPQFAPNTFQNWKREVELWVAGQPGVSVTQLMAELIHVIPLDVKTEALICAEQTERNPSERAISTIMNLLDARFGRSDSERARSRLSAFTDFKRETQENYNDFRARFTRFAAKLEALQMPTNEKVVFAGRFAHSDCRSANFP